MVEMQTSLPPLTLYLHIPFCVRKCPYCDFRSSAVAVIPEQAYLSAVKRELTWRRHQLADDPRPLQAIFIGGGTPSRLTAATMAALLDHIRALWPLVADCEITLEANPESATPDKMRDWHRMGIQRLSLGIQAFDAARLRFLERSHDLETARRAIRQAIQVGFAALNLDLIYATPGQTLAGWARELAEAMAWAPRHLSCYALTIEPGTPFFRRRQQSAWLALSEAEEVALFRQTRSQLAQGGWVAYETSNFAQPGFACRHNGNYWSFGDYVGIGTAAHGKWTDAAGQIWRSENPATVEAYLAILATGGDAPPHPLLRRHRVTPTEAGRECLLMGLRQAVGVERALYQRLTGVDLVHRHAARLAQWQAAGLIQVDDWRVRLTEQGVLLTDTILLELL
ncbi:MAG: radical SAM family heme chaperone HemW [Magnetococcales bacterium]|nr:radical SAM family heme chaperone HemW [Magnetococcales bacterium]